jgi:NitT/TauT family transport system ATP-binding protein
MNPETVVAPKTRTGSADGDEMTTQLRLDSVSHAFGPLEVLAGLDLAIAARETVGIVGPSGCGKSTLLELVAGLTEPTAGTITIGEAGSSPDRLARCAYMPQRDLLLPWLRAIDNASLGPRLTGARKAEAREIARPLFHRLGLGEFEEAMPGELSGGMRQRVAFARTLLSGKPVLLLDEPLAALDAITRADLQEWLLAALREEARTVLLVTHDVEEALFVADRILVLSRRPGRFVFEERASGDRTRPRAEVVTDAGFVARRERALLALAGGTQGGGG